MPERKEKLNVVFDLVFDGGELTIYFDGSDVTHQVKEQIGEDDFHDLVQSFLPPAPPDPMDLAKEHSLETRAL